MINHIVIQGRLGTDPEIKTTKTGKKVAHVNICCQRNEEQVDWVRIVCWEKNADTMEKFFRRGDEILVEGRLQCSSYDSYEGQKRNYTEIVVSKIHFTSGRKRTGELEGDLDGAEKPELEPLPDDGVLPF